MGKERRTSFPLMGRDEPLANTMIKMRKSEKIDELPDMRELALESRIQDGDVRAAHAMLPEIAK